MKAKNNCGFTLLELMIVLLIISILAAIAYPNYKNFVNKSRRSDGISTLLSMQLAQEKYRATNTSYGTLAQIWGGVTASSDGHYTMAVTAQSGTGYTMTASATGAQASDSEDGTSCGTLTIVMNNMVETKSPTACW